MPLLERNKKADVSAHNAFVLIEKHRRSLFSLRGKKLPKTRQYMLNIEQTVYLLSVIKRIYTVVLGLLGRAQDPYLCTS